MPLVEIVPAPWTDSDVVDRTVALMKEIGQAPVVTKKEVNGFIFNRLQYAIIMEAWRLVEVREIEQGQGNIEMYIQVNATTALKTV